MKQGKDPAFLFYPGDYLRDTQCLSEAQQVAYDRIMCEHIRNIDDVDTIDDIVVPESKVDFFTKRLEGDEKKYLMDLLIPVEGGYQISWVAISVLKRKNFINHQKSNISIRWNNHGNTTEGKTDEFGKGLVYTKPIPLENEIYIYNINKENYKLLLEMSTDFHNFQHQKNPTLLRVVNDKLIENGVAELDKLIRIDGFDIDTIKEVLEFVKNDNRQGFNWNKNLLSLSSIRHKSKTNQNIKFINILADIAVKKTKKSYSQIEVQNLTREGKYTWEDFQWDANIKAYILKKLDNNA